MFRWLKSLFCRKKETDVWSPDRILAEDPAQRQFLADLLNGKHSFLCADVDDLGNIYYNQGPSGKPEIVIMNEEDVNYLSNRQLIYGETLPSGFRTPDVRCEVKGNRLILVK